ncbi:MAG: cytochrome b [Rhodospirillaceae bacterium]|nr:MAG: cytochrome b [Rhodospirillaceae bacterium]
MPQTPQENGIALRVWDAPTRQFHWLLSILIGVSWLSGEVGMMAVHTASGLIILTLLVFRLVWGIVGSTTARFSYFVRGPQVVQAYLAGLLRTPIEPLAGHNPAGGLAIVLMLAALAVQAGSGLFANDDIFTEGPLAHLVSKATSDGLTILHKVTFNILLGLISLHLLANLFYLLVKGENLIRPMITGYRPWPAGQAEPQLHFAGPILAFLVLALSILAVWGLVQL